MIPTDFFKSKSPRARVIANDPETLLLEINPPEVLNMVIGTN